MAADIASGIGTSVTSLAGIYFAAKDAKEQKQLEERLAKLSSDQQQYIADKQLEAKTDIEKMQILYQYLALVKNNDAMLILDKKRYVSYIVLGTGLILLGTVLVIARKQKVYGQ